MTLSILALSKMTLSKGSFSDILRNDYLDHFYTFGENHDFDTFKNDTFENDTFESVWVDRHPHTIKGMCLDISVKKHNLFPLGIFCLS